MGLFEALFEPSDEKLQGLYHRYSAENGYNAVKYHDNPDFDRELIAYAKKNNCSIDEAYTVAATGKRTFKD